MQAFPCGLKLKCWRTSTPSPPGCPAPSSRFQPRMKSSSESGCVLSLETAECPEPLCPWRALPAHGATSRVASEDITPPSSLIRAHASDQVPPGASVGPRTPGPCRLSPVPAGGWPFPTLSLQSLRRRLDPYPAASLECTCPFLPREHRPHATEDAFGTRNCPCNATSTGSRISGLQSFVYLQAPTLARPPDCIHRSIFVLGGRAVYTTHRPGGYPFRDVASLRVRLGQLTRLDLHQLDCSLVGCSLPHPAPRQMASLHAGGEVNGRHPRKRIPREEAEKPRPRYCQVDENLGTRPSLRGAASCGCSRCLRRGRARVSLARTANVSGHGPRSPARDRTITVVKQLGRRRWKKGSIRVSQRYLGAFRSFSLVT